MKVTSWIVNFYVVSFLRTIPSSQTNIAIVEIREEISERLDQTNMIVNVFGQKQSQYAITIAAIISFHFIALELTLLVVIVNIELIVLYEYQKMSIKENKQIIKSLQHRHTKVQPHQKSLSSSFSLFCNSCIGE